MTLGFSGAEKLRAYGGITRQGFQFHPTEEIERAAAAAGFSAVALAELHGKVTEGDWVLRGVA